VEESSAMMMVRGVVLEGGRGGAGGEAGKGGYEGEEERVADLVDG